MDFGCRHFSDNERKLPENLSGLSVNFLERLHNEILVGDGAFGTMLYSRGIGLDQPI